jgi:hypothetical protein
MQIYLGVLLVVFTANLFVCGLANAQDPTSSPSVVASDLPAAAPGASTASPDAPALVPDQSAAAQTPASPKAHSDDELKILTTSYVWLPGVHGTLGAFGYDVGYKASTSDLLSHADFGIMQLFQMQYKKLVVLLDFFWAPFTINNTHTLTLLPNQPNLTTQISLRSQLKYTQTMIAPEFGYRLVDHEKLKVDALTGYRYWYNGFTANITTAQTYNHYHTSSNYADPVLGSRIQVPLSPKLMATIQGDVGGFGAGAQLEYQIVGALTYKIKPKWAANVAWRYNYIDYGTIVQSRLAMSGLVIGVTHLWKGPE